jgi:hypothetical protein
MRGVKLLWFVRGGGCEFGDGIMRGVEGELQVVIYETVFKMVIL